jgi:hypothetical protein
MSEMSQMSQLLTLDPSGDKGCTPAPNPWKPPRGRIVVIINNTEHDQTLSKIEPGCLTRPGHGTVTSITIGSNSNNPWIGRAGSNSGTYEYDDGDPSKLAPRIGTIDPS